MVGGAGALRFGRRGLYVLVGGGFTFWWAGALRFGQQQQQQPYTRVNYILQSGTKNLATAKHAYISSRGSLSRDFRLQVFS